MSRVQLCELAAIVATTHIAIVILDLAGRVSYPGETMLGLLADHPAWMWAHLGAAIAIVVTTSARRREWIAMSVSTGVLGIWSSIMLTWRIGATPPLPLLGPTLGLIIAGLACWLAHYWNDRED